MGAKGEREGGRGLANALQKVCHKHKAPKDADNGIKYRQAWAGGGRCMAQLPLKLKLN